MMPLLNVLTDETFEVKTSNGRSVVAFLNSTGPCPEARNFLEEFEPLEGVSYFQVDADVSEELVMKYVVHFLPTVLILVNGKLVDKIVGLDWVRLLKETLAKHFQQ